MQTKVDVPYGSLKSAGSPNLKTMASYVGGRFREEPHDNYLVSVAIDDLTVSEIIEVTAMVKEAGNTTDYRLLSAVSQYSSGEFDKKVPNFKAFPAGLKAFLSHNLNRGWVFRRHGKHLVPYAVTSVRYSEGDKSRDIKPSCALNMEAYSPESSWGRQSKSFSVSSASVTWEPSEVTHKTISDILWDAGIILETEELLAEFDASFDRFQKDMLGRFPQQLVSVSGFDEDEMLPGAKRKVIHDLKEDDVSAPPVCAHGSIMKDNPPMPMHPMIRVFDLSSHSFSWTHSDDLTVYEYDKGLKDKLVLPRSHRDLLDVLTSDLSAFSTDIIAGKSAGNIIVCKGAPGLGKTLTAEVYSELTETPIYAVHSGSMGTSASEVEKSLKVIFKRQRRWGCIVLLDEADVFVKRRGDNLNQNAIVAEFLRTLEYFDGLLFMTTNRPDDIDDAIISRAAAIIHYDPPSEVHRKRIWDVMFENNGVKPPKGLVNQLVALFPTIAPRDIKMLLRLVLRVAENKQVELTTDLFRRIALFRAVQIAEDVEDIEDDEDLI